MGKNQFVVLTLANGGARCLINRGNIAAALRIDPKAEEGAEKPAAYTRILPREIVVEAESNWIDVTETPEEIARMLK